LKLADTAFLYARGKCSNWVKDGEKIRRTPFDKEKLRKKKPPRNRKKKRRSGWTISGLGVRTDFIGGR